MSVCWKPASCECPQCGPLDPGPVSHGGHAYFRECGLCGEIVDGYRFHRSKPGQLINTATGEEVPLLAIVEWHDGCTPKEES